MSAHVEVSQHLSFRPVNIYPSFSGPGLVAVGNIALSGVSTINATDDIVVFVRRGTTGITQIYPYDALASDYIVLTSRNMSSSNTRQLEIMDDIKGAAFKITLLQCPENCTLPACVTENYAGSIPQHNCLHISKYSCLVLLI